jgi:GntR family transcriptional regulator / MocR family aminotransferase
MPRIATPVHLTLSVADGPAPLRHRISDALMEEIRSGRLLPGDTLPPTRALATNLGVARGAVVDAYDELSASGFVIAVAGSATRVAPGATEVAMAATSPREIPPAPPAHPIRAELVRTPIRADLRIGRPDASLISKVDWRRSWRSAAFLVPPLPADGEGWVPELRLALCTHLRRTRGLILQPNEIFVVPGALSAIRTLALAAELRGKTVAVEDPGYDGARNVLTSAGVDVRAISIDSDGLNPATLQPDDAAAYVTPAHQFPLGYRMSPSRRKSLLQWARLHNALIIEDDYDGEFRYNVPPAPALAAGRYGRDLVAYIGTASKMLTPGLRVAWFVPPRRLRRAVIDTLNGSLETIDLVTGRALADFIDSGALIRHLARASRTYSVRRAAFVAAVEEYLIGCRVVGIEAGLHVSVLLPAGTDASDIVDRLRNRGIAINGMEQYSVNGTERPTLLCNYAQVPESQAARVVRTIADVLAGERHSN